MTLVAEVANVKRVPEGHGVSYGLRYRTAAASTLVLVPLGYADGIPRSGSGRVPVQINGQRFTGSGTIAMDQFIVDVGDAQVEVRGSRSNSSVPGPTRDRPPMTGHAPAAPSTTRS